MNGRQAAKAAAKRIEELEALVAGQVQDIKDLYAAIRARDMEAILQVFLRQPLCSRLSEAQGRALFGEMVRATADQLAPWYGPSI